MIATKYVVDECGLFDARVHVVLVDAVDVAIMIVAGESIAITSIRVIVIITINVVITITLSITRVSISLIVVVAVTIRLTVYVKIIKTGLPHVINEISKEFVRIFLASKLKAFVDIFQTLNYGTRLDGCTIGTSDSFDESLHLAEHTKVIQFACLRVATLVLDEEIVQRRAVGETL